MSSLLHSATLVMSGIFVYIKFNIAVSSMIIFSLSSSLMILSVFSVDDRDLKKIVASSTVVMTGFVFLLVVHDSLSAAISVTIFHAGYKSILFICCGRLIASLNSSSDSLLSSIRGVQSVVLLPLIFALASPGSAYGTTKHAFSLGHSGISSASTVELLISVPTLIVCLVSFKIMSNLRYTVRSFGFPIGAIGLNLV